MAKGKVCLILIETKKIRGENVLAGTILMEGACGRNLIPEDITKAVQLGQVQVEIREGKDEK